MKYRPRHIRGLSRPITPTGPLCICGARLGLLAFCYEEGVTERTMCDGCIAEYHEQIPTMMWGKRKGPITVHKIGFGDRVLRRAPQPATGPIGIGAEGHLNRYLCPMCANHFEQPNNEVSECPFCKRERQSIEFWERVGRGEPPQTDGGHNHVHVPVVYQTIPPEIEYCRFCGVNVATTSQYDPHGWRQLSCIDCVVDNLPEG